MKALWITLGIIGAGTAGYFFWKSKNLSRAELLEWLKQTDPGVNWDPDDRSGVERLLSIYEIVF